MSSLTSVTSTRVHNFINLHQYLKLALTSNDFHLLPPASTYALNRFPPTYTGVHELPHRLPLTSIDFHEFPHRLSRTSIVSISTSFDWLTTSTCIFIHRPPHRLPSTSTSFHNYLHRLPLTSTSFHMDTLLRFVLRAVGLRRLLRRADYISAPLLLVSGSRALNEIRSSGGSGYQAGTSKKLEVDDNCIQVDGSRWK